MYDSPEILTSDIWHSAKEMGFVAAGFTYLTELQGEMEHYMKALNRGNFADLEYLKRNCDRRANPVLLLPEARSIMVFLVPYGSNSAKEAAEIDFSDGEGKCVESHKVSQYARGEDYHGIIKDRLHRLLESLKTETGICPAPLKARVFVDSAPVLERAWAVRAGLGFIGKSNFLISKDVGIRNFIGVIISNLSFADTEAGRYSAYAVTGNERVNSDMVQKEGCGNCSRCIASCPTAALSPYSLSIGKCVSYLTVERKGADIGQNRSEAAERGGWLFGCDACMNACPWNSRNIEGWPEFRQKENPIIAINLKRR